MKSKYIKFSTIAMALILAGPVVVPSATAMAGNATFTEISVDNGETTKTFKVESADGALTEDSKFEVNNGPVATEDTTITSVVKINGEIIDDATVVADSEVDGKYIVTLPAGMYVENGELITVDFSSNVAPKEEESDLSLPGGKETDAKKRTRRDLVQNSGNTKLRPTQVASAFIPEEYKKTGTRVRPGVSMDRLDTFTVGLPAGQTANNVFFETGPAMGDVLAPQSSTHFNWYEVTLNGKDIPFKLETTGSLHDYTGVIKLDPTLSIKNGDVFTIFNRVMSSNTPGSHNLVFSTINATKDDGEPYYLDTWEDGITSYTVMNRYLDFVSAPVNIQFAKEDYISNHTYTNPELMYSGYGDTGLPAHVTYGEGFVLDYGSDNNNDPVPDNWSITAKYSNSNSTMSDYGALYLIYDKNQPIDEPSNFVKLPGAGEDPVTIIDPTIMADHSETLNQGINNIFKNLTFKFITNSNKPSYGSIVGNFHWTFTSAPLS